ncbi:MAG: hypothetical protein JNG83_06765 [Opitutaceae bacterium]|nr:hypothetical protein [Opitutaceae bacterium]
MSGIRRDGTGSLRAFSLVELLVAVAITLLLVGMLVAIVDTTLQGWRRAQGDLASATQARLALDWIERDLQSALRHPGGTATGFAVGVATEAGSRVLHGWLPASGSGKPGGTASWRPLPPAVEDIPGALAEARFGWSGAWLRCFTHNPESSGSQVVAVAYQLCRRPVGGPVNPTNPAPVRYSLYRSAVTGEKTWLAGLDLSAAAYASPSSQPGATREPATLTNPNQADLLAVRVVDFGIWLYVRESGGALRRVFPVSEADREHGVAGNVPLPDVVDVMIRILTEQGAARIEAMERGERTVVRPPEVADDAAWWWAEVEAHSQVYVRRIERVATVP